MERYGQKKQLSRVQLDESADMEKRRVVESRIIYGQENPGEHFW